MGSEKILTIEWKLFEGEFFNGIAHGYGIYRLPGGYVFAGMWWQGYKHGKGEEI